MMGLFLCFFTRYLESSYIFSKELFKTFVGQQFINEFKNSLLVFGVKFLNKPNLFDRRFIFYCYLRRDTALEINNLVGSDTRFFLQKCEKFTFQTNRLVFLSNWVKLLKGTIFPSGRVYNFGNAVIGYKRFLSPILSIIKRTFDYTKNKKQNQGLLHKKNRLLNLYRVKLHKRT